MKLLGLTLVPAALSVLLSTSAQAQLLFRDTFNTAKVNAQLDPSPADLPNTNYKGEGQSGSLTTPIAYTTSGGASNTRISDNRRVTVTAYEGLSSTFSPDHNFTDSQNLVIDVTLDRPTGAVGWIRFGTAPNAELGGNSAGGAIAVYEDGSVVLFENTGGVAHLNKVLNEKDNVLSLTLNSDANYDETGTVTASLTVNGEIFDLNGAGEGTSYTFNRGFTQNHLTFGHYSQNGETNTKVNDFQVTALP